MLADRGIPSEPIHLDRLFILILGTLRLLYLRFFYVSSNVNYYEEPIILGKK